LSCAPGQGNNYPMSTSSPLVVAALSGGVDSAAAAALLVERGHRVVGMTMRLYDARGTVASAGRCCGPRDVDDARRVCEHLGIPFYVVDFAAEFAAAVVDDFVEAYLGGETPNPCVKCNQHIKFTPLLQRARAIGADVVATGHYARLDPDGAGGYRLRRGVDTSKDQSYFLFSMPPEELGAVRFPLGAMAKDEVRARAAALGLPNAAKPESQEICFVPDGDYAGFVAREALHRGRVPAAGAIIDRAGAILGHHDGVHAFTIGQRRGLGNLRPAPGLDRDRLYVTGIDPAARTITVGPRDLAERPTLSLRDLRWLSPPRDTPFETLVQIRHRGTPHRALVTPTGPTATLRFLDTAPIAAPGQAAVLYDADTVLAGGWIGDRLDAPAG
jgi:tRNA-specific 2-thiouridylase